MNIQELKQIELTGRDFQLMVDGLKAIEMKDAAGDLMGSLLGAMLAKDDAQREEMRAAHEKEQAKKRAAQELIKEDVMILQGKLLMFKRFLQENGLLKEANEILNVNP